MKEYKNGPRYRQTLKMILFLSCKYCHKIEADGRCYSGECSFNMDDGITKEIKTKGCTIYKRNPQMIGDKQ